MRWLSRLGLAPRRRLFRPVFAATSASSSRRKGLLIRGAVLSAVLLLGGASAV
jgi:hypothetical protein